MAIRKLLRLTAVCSILLIMAACSSSDDEVTATRNGRVLSGDTPIADALVTLYAAGEERRSGAVMLGTGQTDANGYFKISYTPKGHKR